MCRCFTEQKVKQCRMSNLLPLVVTPSYRCVLVCTTVDNIHSPLYEWPPRHPRAARVAVSVPSCRGHRFSTCSVVGLDRVNHCRSHSPSGSLRQETTLSLTQGARATESKRVCVLRCGSSGCCNRSSVFFTSLRAGGQLTILLCIHFLFEAAQLRKCGTKLKSWSSSDIHT